MGMLTATQNVFQCACPRVRVRVRARFRVRIRVRVSVRIRRETFYDVNDLRIELRLAVV